MKKQTVAKFQKLLDMTRIAKHALSEKNFRFLILFVKRNGIFTQRSTAMKIMSALLSLEQYYETDDDAANYITDIYEALLEQFN